VRRLEAFELNDPVVWKSFLGRKVSMRLRHHGDPEHPFTEAIGVVQSVRTDADGAARLVIVDRRGAEHVHALADVLAAKIF
jgi:hypothetical protein